MSEMLRRRVDGLILTTASRENQSYLFPSAARELLVFVDREPAGYRRGCRRRPTTRGAAEKRRRTSSRAGTGGSPTSATDARCGPPRNAAAGSSSARPRRHPDHGHPDHRRAARRGMPLAALARTARGRRPPTAMFSARTSSPSARCARCARASLQRTVALVGFDDIPLGDMLEPGVTVVAQDPAADGAGRRGARVRAGLEGDDGPARHTIIPTTLIPRGSGEIAPDQTHRTIAPEGSSGTADRRSAARQAVTAERDNAGCARSRADRPGRCLHDSLRFEIQKGISGRRPGSPGRHQASGRAFAALHLESRVPRLDAPSHEHADESSRRMASSTTSSGSSPP